MDEVRDWGHSSRPLLRCLSFGASWSKLMVGKYCDILNRIATLKYSIRIACIKNDKFSPLELIYVLQITIYRRQFEFWSSCTEGHGNIYESNMGIDGTLSRRTPNAKDIKFSKGETLKV